MMRTIVNYPVLRQNKRVLLNEFVKKLPSLESFLYILSIYPFLLPVLMYNVVSFYRGAFLTYSIIHHYFALVQGSSYKVSPSILYPLWKNKLVYNFIASK